MSIEEKGAGVSSGIQTTKTKHKDYNNMNPEDYNQVYSIKAKDLLKYGFIETFFIEYLKDEIKLAKRLNSNFINGKYWSVNKAKERIKIFPFCNEKKLWRIIQKLNKLCVVIIANYNEHPMDKTQWLTINEEFYNG